MTGMDVYVGHCPTQSLANQALERELKNNAAFKAFHDTQLRLPQMRKLPLTSFLGRTLTWLGKYPIVRVTLRARTDACARIGVGASGTDSKRVRL
jgi:hypothetical protein